jgi:hypothetical protein
LQLKYVCPKNQKINKFKSSNDQIFVIISFTYKKWKIKSHSATGISEEEDKFSDYYWPTLAFNGMTKFILALKPGLEVVTNLS